MLKLQKYITFRSVKGDEIITFPNHIAHFEMAINVRRMTFVPLEPISAGFIDKGRCVGKSESLSLGCNHRDQVLLDLLGK